MQNIGERVMGIIFCHLNLGNILKRIRESLRCIFFLLLYQLQEWEIKNDFSKLENERKDLEERSNSKIINKWKLL